MNTVKINNNISVHYIEMKKLKTTNVGVYIRRRLKKEEAAKNALLPSVLKSGCKKYPSVGAIAKELQELYGASMGAGVLKMGDNQIITFSAETISNRYAPNGEDLLSELCSLLMSVIFEPLIKNGGFDPEIVKREKTTKKNEIEALINDKRSYASMRCSEELCRGDAYAVPKLGTAEDIEKTDEKSLYEHYNRILTSSYIDIFATGEADIEKIAEVVKKYTAGAEFSQPEDIPVSAIPKKNGTENITEKMDVTQGKLSIGFTTGISIKSPEYPALMIANSVFGAGTHSKLFNNVREKLSLAYYASSGLVGHKGIIIMNAGIEFKNFKTAYDETIRQLDELKAGNISDEELSFSKNMYIDTLNSLYDSQHAMQISALDSILTGIPFDIENDKKKLLTVTKEDVVRVSQNITENIIYFLCGKDE